MNRIACTACGHEIRYRDEHAGRRVRCPACSGVLRLPSAENLDLEPLGEGTTLMSERGARAPVQPAAAAPNPKPPRPRRPFLRPRAEWTAWDAVVFKTGIGVIAFGAAAILLPMFGLQFRKLAKLGESGSTSAGWGLIGTGVFLIAYVVALRGRMLRLVLVVVAAGFLGFVVLLAIGALSSWSRSSSPPGVSSPRGPLAGAPSAQPGRPPDFPRGGQPDPHPPGPVFTPPQGPAAGASTDEIVADLARRFGASKVVQVTLEGATGEEIGLHLREIGTKTLTNSGASSYRTRPSGDAQLLIIAPIDDIDGFVARLDLGPAAQIDRAGRTVTIKVDRARLRARP